MWQSEREFQSRLSLIKIGRHACKHDNQGMYNKGGGGGGGGTPIGAVSGAATGGQDAVKRSSSVLGHYISTALYIYGTIGGSRSGGRSFCACAVNRWSLGMGQGQKFGVVKRSRPFFDGQKS